MAEPEKFFQLYVGASGVTELKNVTPGGTKSFFLISYDEKTNKFSVVAHVPKQYGNAYLQAITQTFMGNPKDPEETVQVIPLDDPKALAGLFNLLKSRGVQVDVKENPNEHSGIQPPGAPEGGSQAPAPGSSPNA